jgi:PKD domain
MGVLKRGSRRACAVLLIGAMVAPLVLSRPASAATPVASFDWSMPDRFGPDRNSDGLIDYVDGGNDHVTGYDATPDTWHVDLDACGSTDDDGATYQWTVVDQPNPATPITVQGGPGCDDFFMDVPEEGTYRVDLVVNANGEQSAPLRRHVVVQDWLVVSLGDSYGSGEGAPDIPIDQSELAQAQAAWEAHEAARQQLFTLQTSLEPVNEAIAEWQHWLDTAAYYCDLSRHDADAILCAQALANAAASGAGVIGQLVLLGINVVGETIGDVVNVVGAAINSAVQTVQAAKQVADSVTGALSATWQAERCHRSANSGSAQAARALEDADAHTSVTFVHLACSGATMTYGLLGWYQGTEHPDDVTNVGCNPADPAERPAACIPPQVQIAKNIVGSREVDATYVSIGGNDAHFADIVIACIVQDDCSTESGGASSQLIDHLCGEVLLPLGYVPVALCYMLVPGLVPDTRSAAELIYEGINGDVTDEIDPMFPGLANGYNSIAPTLVGSGGLLPTGREDRVFLSQYVDAVKSDDGTLCDFETMGYESIPGLSSTESAFIDSAVIPALFGAIEEATDVHGWTYVDGVYDGFTNHGYCADDHYMVRAQETFLIEGRYHGIVHPNTDGYAAYRDAILAKWLDQMYPSGAAGGARRPDQRPYVDAGAAVTVAEGQSTTLGSSMLDSDGDTVSISWTHDRPNKVTIAPTTSVAPTLAGKDDTTGTATMTATDADGWRTDTVPFTVTNVAPVIGSLSALYNPVPLGTALNAFVPYTDAGVWDTHTARFDWGDGTTPTLALGVGGGGTGGASAYHTYAAPGLYPVTITVTDDDGGSDTVVHEFVVVYDASGGFATGGGWFQSPTGAYTPSDTTDPDVTGRANFAFVSKYARNATTPSGTTSFRFSAADLDFESTSYDWMVVSGTKATYRGTGELNVVAGYRFMLVANDGSSRSGGVDQLRVRISDPAGVVVYDNQAGASLDAAPTTAIGGGQIAVHR